MARPPNPRTYIRRELERDALLPVDSPQKLTPSQRVELLKMLANLPRVGAPKGTKPAHTGKIKKPSRYLTENDIQRLRGKEKEPKKTIETTLGDFLNTVEEENKNA